MPQGYIKSKKITTVILGLSMVEEGDRKVKEKLQFSGGSALMEVNVEGESKKKFNIRSRGKELESTSWKWGGVS